MVVWFRYFSVLVFQLHSLDIARRVIFDLALTGDTRSIPRVLPQDMPWEQYDSHFFRNIGGSFAITLQWIL
jgi:hypothetical protein